MRPLMTRPDAPLRQPARAQVRSARIDARSQLRHSLWLMAVIGVALAAVAAARPSVPNGTQASFAASAVVAMR